MLTADELMRQAWMTAHDYMLNAICDIDKLLGKGYAKEHPELIAAYMKTAAMDFHTVFTADMNRQLAYDNYLTASHNKEEPCL